MKKLKYDIYLGCNDKVTHKEVISRAYIESQLKQLFKKNKVGFSIVKQVGGYIHEDGTYIRENSIKLTLIGSISTVQINKLISVLKDKVNQEKILLVKKDVTMKYYHSEEE